MTTDRLIFVGLRGYVLALDREPARSRGPTTT